MFATLFGLYLLVLSEFRNPRAENILKRSKRVVGGYSAYIEQMPYMVSIRRNGAFECGGSLITPYCVLTAAHCVKNGGPKEFEVRGGSTYLEDTRHIRRVKHIFVPYLYSNKTLKYDVAVFKLQYPIKSPNTDTIQLASHLPRVGEYIRVSGWGLTSETASKPSNQLRTVDLKMLPRSYCNLLFRNYRRVTREMFCAAIPGSRDACAGDSGGPAVVNGKIVGVVSWGRKHECGRVDSPGAYVSIPAVRHWIDEVIQLACL